jgi:hypothetical protein
MIVGHYITVSRDEKARPFAGNGVASLWRMRAELIAELPEKPVLPRRTV